MGRNGRGKREEEEEEEKKRRGAATKQRGHDGGKAGSLEGKAQAVVVI